jgi:hypothetical protein
MPKRRVNLLHEESEEQGQYVCIKENRSDMVIDDS